MISQSEDQQPVAGSMALYILIRDGKITGYGRPGGGAKGAKKWQKDMDKWHLDEVGLAKHKPSVLFVKVAE